MTWLTVFLRPHLGCREWCHESIQDQQHQRQYWQRTHAQQPMTNHQHPAKLIGVIFLITSKIFRVPPPSHTNKKICSVRPQRLATGAPSIVLHSISIFESHQLRRWSANSLPELTAKASFRFQPSQTSKTLGKTAGNLYANPKARRCSKGEKQTAHPESWILWQ